MTQNQHLSERNPVLPADLETTLDGIQMDMRIVLGVAITNTVILVLVLSGIL